MKRGSELAGTLVPTFPGCDPFVPAEAKANDRGVRIHRHALMIGLATLYACPASAADAPKYHVTATEVEVSTKSTEHAWFKERLQHASQTEAEYYPPATSPVVLRVVIDKVKLKSAGKALASSLPIVGMFSGSNENRLRGKVTLVDEATGRTVKRFKIDCDDYTQFSAADGVFAYAQLGMSFLPFGELIAGAAEVGRSAASKRTAVQQKLVAGFTMLSYKKIYGAKLYKRFAARRRADVTAENAPATPMPAPSPPTGEVAARSMVGATTS